MKWWFGHTPSVPCRGRRVCARQEKHSPHQTPIREMKVVFKLIGHLLCRLFFHHTSRSFYTPAFIPFFLIIDLSWIDHILSWAFFFPIYFLFECSLCLSIQWSAKAFTHWLVFKKIDKNNFVLYIFYDLTSNYNFYTFLVF